MSVSTNGIIAFGVPFEEGAKFPWDIEQFDGDIENWWRDVNGFKDIHEPWTPEGEYAAGWKKDDPRFDEYYNHRRNWLNENPVPVELENYCSAEYPMFAITIPGLGLGCCRGSPAELDPALLVATSEQIKSLKDFFREHGIETDGEPQWLLMSYWG